MNLPPYTVAQLAAHWQCRDTFVYDRINGGELPAFRLGGKLLRIRRQAVEDYEGRAGEEDTGAATEASHGSGLAMEDRTASRLARLAR